MTNALLSPFTLPHGLPPFGNIAIDQYRPAFDAAMIAHNAEIDAIVRTIAEPSFDNTIAALERCGWLLDRVGSVFWNLVGTDGTQAMLDIEREIGPVLSRHMAMISTNTALFQRIDRLFEMRQSLSLTPEQLRVLELTHLRFMRSGAKLDEANKERFNTISTRLTELGIAFSQNVLADEASFELVLAELDLIGLPDFVIAAAKQAGCDRNKPDSYVITLSRSLIEPFLTYSPRRDLREKAHHAWTRRGDNGGAHDNGALIAETLTLRAERAKLLGYASFADFKLAQEMAKTPQYVEDLLLRVWTPAKALFGQEKLDLEELAATQGVNNAIEPWDWRFYSEQVRKVRHDLNEAEIKPYLQLERVIDAAFYVATRLFGLTFVQRDDLVGYHPDVRIFEARDATAKHVGLFLGDYFNRSTKRSGAWMSSFREQHKLGEASTSGDIRPIIINVMNFSKPAEGSPALLSVDDARTLFHEFGHGLHGLLSNVTYPSIAGTSVARDFVELPSQLYEHWLLTPEVLSQFAIHADTGEAMPAALIDKIVAAQTFNQGCGTVEYTSSALVDQAFHTGNSPVADPIAFEKAELARIGMPIGSVMRHRSPHFSHIFSGDGYSAGYYSYLWSEVLDSDAFEAFEATGDIFNPELAEKLKTHIYSAGGSRDPVELYTAFRGGMPTADALLKKRGLAA